MTEMQSARAHIARVRSRVVEFCRLRISKVQSRRAGLSVRAWTTPGKAAATRGGDLRWSAERQESQCLLRQQGGGKERLAERQPGRDRDLICSNGADKSTKLRSICDLLLPTSRTVLFQGKSVVAVLRRKVRRRGNRPVA
jgi:hypothetical protein